MIIKSRAYNNSVKILDDLRKDKKNNLSFFNPENEYFPPLPVLPNFMRKTYKYNNYTVNLAAFQCSCKNNEALNQCETTLCRHTLSILLSRCNNFLTNNFKNFHKLVLRYNIEKYYILLENDNTLLISPLSEDKVIVFRLYEPHVYYIYNLDLGEWFWDKRPDHSKKILEMVLR